MAVNIRTGSHFIFLTPFSFLRSQRRSMSEIAEKKKPVAYPLFVTTCVVMSAMM